MAEIIEVKEEAIVAAVEETSGAATGTKVVSNHSATGANQHSIGAITGLEERLQTIEALKSTISTKKRGHADYYMWGETWDDEKNTPGHGYFVRLGFVEVEDGKYEERIYKCEGEEAEVQTSLPLETKEVVIDDSAAWSESGKITTKIYYVTATKTYYNYEVAAWVPYTEEEYKEIALDKIVVKYSYAGEIQTKDIAKYYIVGCFNNETKQWIEPCDIYAYNGIEYVKKPSYGYKNGGVYKNALMDVLGVTVPSSMVGFIGNQGDEDNSKNDETKYALVATTGVVDVLCDHDVAVGDYVQPYACGWAKKSTGSYGYLVTALVQNEKIVSVAGDGLLYVRIVLEPSMALDKELSNNVDSLLETTRRLDANIISFGNTASQAYSMADRALKLAQDSATDSKVNSDDANKYAQDAAGSASDAWDKADSAAQSASNAEVAAAQAQKEAAEARGYINEEISKARSDASDALALAVDNNLKALRALEYRLDDYSVGRYSQAYGLTWDQAKTILPANETREDGKVHSIVFIPMSEDPLLNDECIYEEVYSATPEDVRKQFMVSYSYVWTNDGWDAGTQNVSFTTTEPVGNEDAYWYVPNSYAGTEFKKEALYHYENGGWVHVATRDENVMGRAVAYINNAADTITQSVTGIAGQVSAIQTKVDKEGAKTSMWASVPTELEGKKPVNYYETGEVPEVVENFVTFTSTSEIDVEIAKGHLEQKTDLYYDEKYNCIYYCIGAALPYQVYRAELVDDEVVFAEELVVTYDGVDLYRVNTASIVAAVNQDGDSSLQFNANKIQFNGQGIFQDKDGNITQIDGNYITTGTIDASKATITNINASEITSGTLDADRITVDTILGKLSESGQSELKISSDYINIDGIDVNLKGKTINLTTDEIEIQSTNFNVTKDGSVEATKGIIGGYTLENEMLYAGNEVGYVGLDARCETEKILENDVYRNVLQYPYAFYAGSENPDMAPFRVTKQGVLTSDIGNFSGKISSRVGSIGPIKFNNNSFNALSISVSIRSDIDDGIDISVYAKADSELKSNTPVQANYNRWNSDTGWTTRYDDPTIYTGTYPAVLSWFSTYTPNSSSKPTKIIYTKPNIIFTIDKVQSDDFSYNMQNGQWAEAEIDSDFNFIYNGETTNNINISPGGVIYFLNTQGAIMSIYHIPSGHDFFGSTKDNLFTVKSDYRYVGSINCGNKSTASDYSQSSTNNPAEGFYLDKNYLFMSGSTSGTSINVKGDIKCDQVNTNGITLKSTSEQSSITYDGTNVNIGKIKSTSIVDASGYNVFGRKFYFWEYIGSVTENAPQSITISSTTHKLSTVKGAIVTPRTSSDDMGNWNNIVANDTQIGVYISGTTVKICVDNGELKDGFYCLIYGE